MRAERPPSGPAERPPSVLCRLSAVRVGFVVCPSYHGATLLALLLNNHSRVSALGDTLPFRHVDPICACGQRVSACEFWQSVSAGLDTSRFVHLRTWLPAMPWPLTHHQLEGSLLPVSGDARINRAAGRLARGVADALAQAAWRVRPGAARDFAATYVDFYRLVMDLQGTSMFVDGFKSWRRAALLADELESSAEVKIVHLVRDPRGFAVSRRTNDSSQDPREAAWLWADLHARMHGLRRSTPYYLLRYEDLCAQPETQMRALLEFLGLDSEPVVAAPRFPDKHHLIGNRMLQTFAGEVRLDERWRTELPMLEQRQVLASAGDLAERFGYTLERDAVVQPQSA
jgi:Sulfotransferase domain